MQCLADLIGEAPPVRSLREQIATLARNGTVKRPPPVLVGGETGTGKGLVASALHFESQRAGRPFIEVNCAAIPETLLEAELFGYQRGAFTDARQAKPGLFQAAHGGTLFLDEVGLLPEALQAKLLKVLEAHTVRRLGSVRSEPVDVWVVAATSEDLNNAIRLRRFRIDLYHRLALVTLALPPLRERGKDILLLAEHFLSRACAEHARPPKRLSSDARAALLSHLWPGNVRELSNAMERLALLSDAQLVTAELLGLPAQSMQDSTRVRAPNGPAGGAKRIEREQLLHVLRETGWNASRAAEALAVSRNAIRYWMSKYGLGQDPKKRQIELPQQPLPEIAAVGARTTIRWERRLLVFLRGSIRQPPDGHSHSSTSALELLIEKIQSFGGRIEELRPGEIFSAFGLTPLEEAARRAAHAALAVQRAWARDRRPGNASASILIGLHASEVLVGQAGEWTGIDESDKRQANSTLDALVQRAETGGTIVSEAAARLMERRFTLVADPPDGRSPRTYRLNRHESGGLGMAGRLSRFVGREAELVRLECVFDEAVGGSLRFANIAGAPGIGKSRLIHELCLRRASDRLTFVQCPSTPDGSPTPFGPLIEVVRSSFSLREDEKLDEAQEKLRRGVERLGLRSERILPPLMATLRLESEAPVNLEAELMGERLREALIEFIRASCQVTPIVLLLDDVHWADSASVQLLLRLLETREQMPLLIVCAYRPPYRPPWVGEPGVCELELQPLSEESCLYLVDERLGASGHPLAREVVARANGNPLFAEEIARYLQERRGYPSDAGERAVPDTLQHLLMPTVNRLTGATRATLEAAAVIGTHFGSNLLQAVLASDQEVSARLYALEQRDLVVREETPSRTAEYRFKHVLVRDAVYASLPSARREDLHLRIAESIERIFQGRVQEVAEALALHYRCAGRVKKAVEYLCLAGEKSLRVHSLDEAERSFDQVIEQIEANTGILSDATLADALLGKMRICFFRCNVRAMIHLAEKYRSRVEALGDERRLCAFLHWLGWSFGCAGRFAEARKLFDECLTRAEKCGDDWAIGYASRGLIQSECFLRDGSGQLRFEELGSRAMAIAERLRDAYLKCDCLLAFATNAYSRGRFADANVYADQLLELGRRERSRRVSAHGFMQHAFLSMFEGRCGHALEYAEKAIQLAVDPLGNLMGRCAKASALSALGRAQEALQILGTIYGDMERDGYFCLRYMTDVAYGVAVVQSGRIAAGVRWIERAVNSYGEVNLFFPASAHLVLGEIFLELALRRQSAPPPRVLLRNLGFIMRNVLFAAGKARCHLE